MIWQVGIVQACLAPVYCIGKTLCLEALLMTQIEPIRWRNDALELLDQRLLPGQEVYLRLATCLEVAQAIGQMVVRGAPAIGITAAFGMALAAREAGGSLHWRDRLREAGNVLKAARPTAVNLSWAVQQQAELARQQPDAAQAYTELLRAAQALLAQDIADNRRMGQLGAALLPTEGGILTHCNTGSLATGGYGTALGVIRAGFERGYRWQVYVDETRPWLQGARLTAWELQQEGIPFQLNVDSAAGHLMATGKIQAVIVGADRIAANGDTANKIGTYSLAVLAHYHHIPFYVAAPLSTVDFALANGAGIVIEERDEQEVRRCGAQEIAPTAVAVRNPAFDVTPAALITAIITEQGVAHGPFAENLAKLRP